MGNSLFCSSDCVRLISSKKAASVSQNADGLLIYSGLAVLRLDGNPIEVVVVDYTCVGKLILKTERLGQSCQVEALDRTMVTYEQESVLGR